MKTNKYSIQLHQSVLLLLMLASWLLAAYFFSGFYGSDDISYLKGIFSLARGERLPNYLASVRLTVVAPAAFIFYISGESFFLTVFSFTLYSPLIVLFTYLIARRTHQLSNALLAACIVTLCPLLYRYSGGVLPDVCLAFWTLIWFYLLLRALALLERQNSSGLFYTLCFAIGLSNGIAYAAKESALILAVPTFVMFFITARHQPKTLITSYTIYLAGLVGFIVLEYYGLYLLSDKYIFRIGWSENAEFSGVILKKLETYGSNSLERAQFALKAMKFYLGKTPIFILLAGTLAYPLLRKRPLYIWGTFIWLAGYHLFGTTSLSSYRPMSIQPRYYILALPFAAIIMAHCTLAVSGFVLSPIARIFGAKANSLMPSLGALALVLFWGGQQISNSLPVAGKNYQAVQVQNFIRAFNYSRENYPELPVVLSPYASRRMNPLFKDVCADEKLYSTHQMLTCNFGTLPDPPFLYLHIQNDYAEAKYQNKHAPNLKDPKYQVTALKSISSTGVRWSQLLKDNAAMLNQVYGLRRRPGGREKKRFTISLVESKPTS